MSLNTGIDALCRYGWDEKKQQFTERDTLDILKCCIDRCRVPVDFCYKRCQQTYGKDGETPDKYKHFVCNQICNDQRVVCQEGCEANSLWGMDNPFIACAKKHGCWPGIAGDPDCIKKNKNKLIQCCLSECETEGCADFCQYTYDLSKEPKESADFWQRSEYAPAQVSYEDETWKYVMAGVLVSTVIIVTFLLLRRPKNRS